MSHAIRIFVAFAVGTLAGASHVAGQAVIKAQQPRVISPATPTAAARSVLSMDDRAIIIIGGKQATIAQLKSDIAARSPQGIVRDLLGLDDRAIIVIGGTPTQAGPVKQEINAELAKRATPPVRKPGDTATLNPQPLPPKATTPAANGGTANPQPVAPRPAIGATPVQQPAQKPAVKPGDTVALNPQPLPPKANDGAKPGDHVMLNPQPLPPKATTPATNGGTANPQPGAPRPAIGATPVQQPAQKTPVKPGDTVTLNPQPLPPKAVIGAMAPAGAAATQAPPATAGGSSTRPNGTLQQPAMTTRANAASLAAATVSAADNGVVVKAGPHSAEFTARISGLKFNGGSAVFVDVFEQRPLYTESSVTPSAVAEVRLQAGGLENDPSGVGFVRVYSGQTPEQLHPNRDYYYTISVPGVGLLLGKFHTLPGAELPAPPPTLHDAQTVDTRQKNAPGAGRPAIGATPVQQAAQTPSQKPGDTVTLNPQPLPPKVATPATSAAPTISQPSGSRPPIGGTQSPVIQGNATSGTTRAAALPKNLFDLDDRAIITIGGTPVAAGAVKGEIRAELLRQAGPARKVSAVRRTNPGQTVAPVMVQQTVVGGPAANAKVDCEQYGPRVTRFDAPIKSGEPFTVHGWCFGNARGSIQIDGRFGTVSPRNPQSWSDDTIRAVMPDVSAVPDHKITVVVKLPNGKESPATQVAFLAARERLEVDPKFWRPTSHFADTDVPEPNALQTRIQPRSNRFRITINPSCSLETMDALPTLGGVQAINGWDTGPLNEASIEIVWVPTCTTTTTDKPFETSWSQVCRVEFDLVAWASCPIGIRP